MDVDQAWAGGPTHLQSAGLGDAAQTQMGLSGACSGPVGQCHWLPLQAGEIPGDRLLSLLWISLMTVGKTVKLSFSVSAPLLIHKTEGEEGNTLF